MHRLFVFKMSEQAYPQIIALGSNKSELSVDFFPSIKGKYYIRFDSFDTYNTIPNIDAKNNKFYYNDEVLTIPEGSYEIEDIKDYLQHHVGDPSSVKLYKDNTITKKNRKNYFKLEANNNTLKCTLFSSCTIDFTKDDSIGELLGFDKRMLLPNVEHESDKPVAIINVNVVRLECNIAMGSYINNKPSHIIHQFYPNVPPGYKIIETPKRETYLPVNTEEINNITVRIVDEEGRLINFRDEKINILIYLQPVSQK